MINSVFLLFLVQNWEKRAYFQRSGSKFYRDFWDSTPDSDAWSLHIVDVTSKGTILVDYDFHLNKLIFPLIQECGEVKTNIVDTRKDTIVRESKLQYKQVPDPGGLAFYM